MYTLSPQNDVFACHRGSVGWHMGTAQVGEVQPAPVPAKPIPAACFTHTHTTNPRVLGNTAGTRKPVPVFHYFSISTWTFFVFLFLFFVFCYVLSILCVLYLWYNIVTT